MVWSCGLPLLHAQSTAHIGNVPTWDVQPSPQLRVSHVPLAAVTVRLLEVSVVQAGVFQGTAEQARGCCVGRDSVIIQPVTHCCVSSSRLLQPGLLAGKELFLPTRSHQALAHITPINVSEATVGEQMLGVGAVPQALVSCSTFCPPYPGEQPVSQCS